MNERKELNYINDIGENKKIVVFPPKEGKYQFDIWSNRTGDWCGSGELTLDEINEFLEHYRIPYRFS